MRSSILVVCSIFVLSCKDLSVLGDEVSDGETDPCKTGHYHELSEPDRAAGFEILYKLKSDKDDLDNDIAWYRFTGEAGTRMAIHCVPEKHCGTEVTGWLNGSRPSKEEGLVTRTVCFHSGGDCCFWKKEVKVRNCGGFYLYHLRRDLPEVNKNYRYCGNGEGPVKPSSSDVCKYQKSKEERCPMKPSSSDVYKSKKCKDERGPVNPSSSDVCKGKESKEERCPVKPSCSDVCKHQKSKEERDNPCLSGDYITLSEPDRAAGFLTTGHAECDRADFNDEEAWYRFSGKAGSRMAKRCVPVRRCGTNAPGWLNGTHPKHEDEGAVTRTVCFNWKNDCCHWKTQVKVRQCGGFYLYYLKRDPWGGCSYRYCGNGRGPTPTEAPTTQVTEATQQTQEPQGNPGMTTAISTKRPTPTEAPTTQVPPPQPEINVTCGKNEMFISIPKKLLRGLDRDHLRLTDLKCGATETPTHFIFRTDLTKCRTKSRHTKDFVIYMNKVEEIPVGPRQIITRAIEVEIPFSCYYSNTGVVSAVGLEVKSKKIVLSKKGRGEFVLEMKIFPNNKFLVHYEKKDFPVHLPLRKELFVEVSVDTEDDTLAILAEECFATPDPNPDKSGLSYIFIKDGCLIDDTVKTIKTDDQRSQRFSMEAFSFIGDHQFVYMHCRIKVCNATDPNSRCKQGCLNDRRRRSLNTQETNDEEYYLAQGPFIRKEEDTKETNLQ